MSFGAIALRHSLRHRASSWNAIVQLQRLCCLQDAIDRQTPSTPSAQLPASASAGSLALPEGMTLEDIAEGSIRFFNDDLCLSIPFKGNHFMSIEAIKSLTPRDVIHLYEVSWHLLSLVLPGIIELPCLTEEAAWWL